MARIPASDPRIAAYAATLAHQPGVAAVSHRARPARQRDRDRRDPGRLRAGRHRPAPGHRRCATNRPAFRTWVTGSAAFLTDFKDQHHPAGCPYALAIIALATFVLLFLMTGSVLIPLKALVMNTLSLGAVFGALVWIFQDGHLASLLGFHAFGAIELWVPVIVFAFAFGLSMDYEVFLLSRIKECYDECGDTNNAVADGLQRSGRIITSAAFLVMIVFLGFAAGQTPGHQGVRPGAGHRRRRRRHPGPLHPGAGHDDPARPANWWAPAPLRRLHQRLGLHEAPAHPASLTGTPAAEAPATAEVSGS